MKATELAEIIITHFDEKGDLITNKKLQKLLYYLEAWFLVHDKSIVDEDFEAWVHGPVIVDVYHLYKKFGASPIKSKYENGDSPEKRLTKFKSKFTKSQTKLFNAIMEKYAPLTSWQLELLSHKEKPWMKAREGYATFAQCSNEIDKKQMKKYYSSLLN